METVRFDLPSFLVSLARSTGGAAEQQILVMEVRRALVGLKVDVVDARVRPF